MTGSSAPRPGGAPAVLAHGLLKRYGPVAALDGVDLEVPAGQFVLLLGPNGAGKSTLLRLLALLTRPTSGALRLDGRDPLSGDAVRLRARIGFLSHHTLLYDHLTGFENLLFYARLYGLPDPRAAAAGGLESASLAGRGQDPVGTYSRGMQQKLAIARALLHGPDLLLLDEPFTGLDRQGADRLQRTLERARGGRRTCILATHDLPAGVRLADRVVVLLEGRVADDRPAAGLDAAGLEGLFQRATRAPAAGAP